MTANPRPRVALTPGSITGVVVAHKRHRCDSHLAGLHFIEPGERYVANALPPHDPEIENRNWWHLRLCLDCCPARYDPREKAPAPIACLVPGDPATEHEAFLLEQQARERGEL